MYVCMYVCIMDIYINVCVYVLLSAQSRYICMCVCMYYINMILEQQMDMYELYVCMIECKTN